MALIFLVEWPILHQLHQLTRFYHCAERPPKMIYVSDGGAVDSSGVLQLLRRRIKRILFVLNEDDSADRLPGLRKLIAAAVDEKLASFYDPDDPRRDWKEVLQAFAADGSRSFLRLGVHYGWQGESRERGHLAVLKNRVPSAMRGAKVQALLTEAEIVGDMHRKPCLANGKLRWTDLGGYVCCCDGCHACTAINARGRRFPNAPIVNQLLTPQYLSELCRLGHAVSEEAINFITQPGPLERTWEEHVGSLQRTASSASFQSCSTEDSWA